MYKYLVILSNQSGNWVTCVTQMSPMYVLEAESDELANVYVRTKLVNVNMKLSLLARITQGLAFDQLDHEYSFGAHVDSEGLDQVHIESLSYGELLLKQLQPFDSAEHTKRLQQKEENEKRSKEREERAKQIPLPQVGDEIYVDTRLHVYRGKDDVLGGLATVMSVSDGKSAGLPVHFVSVKEHPGNNYNWEGYLAPEQDRLKKEFGNERARPDPDMRSEFNDSR